MINVFDYTDYRKYLQDYFQEMKKKNSSFSFRYVAMKGGPDPGNLAKVMKGNRNLTVKAAHSLAEVFKLNKREREYLQAMVLYCQAARHSEKKRYFEEMLSFKESSIRVLNANQYEFYDKWYYTAIRELLAFFPFREGKENELGKLIIPSVTADEVKQAIRLLEQLDLIHKDKKGIYIRKEALISTGTEAKSITLNNYIIKSMKLAEKAIDKLKGEINLSTVTLTIANDDYPKVQEEARRFRRRIMELAKSSQEPDRVYQLNMQMFPITHKYGKSK